MTRLDALLAPAPAPPLARRGLWAALQDLAALRRQRRALATLDDARLRDLGLTRAQARAESLRPFWSAPDHWLR